MLLDRDSVRSLLDKSVEEYDSNLIAINLLPADSVFEVYIEDTITAEYYQEEKDQHFRFVLSYDYFKFGIPVNGFHQRILDTNIRESLEEERKESNVNQLSNTTKIVITSILFLVGILACSTIYYLTN